MVENERELWGPTCVYTSFFDEIERISRKNYVPNVQDVLRARQKSTGITELEFESDDIKIRRVLPPTTQDSVVADSLSIECYVGGQRSGARKWIHCFDSVTSVIFCVALSEYDQVLLEDSTQVVHTRKKEGKKGHFLTATNRIACRTAWCSSNRSSTAVGLSRHRSCCFSTRWISSRERSHACRSEQYFPEYEGGNNPKKAAKYILWRFLQTNHNNLNIYPQLRRWPDLPVSLLNNPHLPLV